MELAEFVSKSLQDVWNGIEAANTAVSKSEKGRDRFYLASKTERTEDAIRFDVAVTASTTVDASAGGGVKIAVVSASLGGSTEHRQEAVSRIQFLVFARW